MHADAYAAELFGIPSREADRGLPLLRYLQSIHPDDLERVSKAICRAVDTGAFYREEYRVISAGRAVLAVMAMGSCRRDAANKPVEYTGMLFRLDPEPSSDPKDELIEACGKAYKLAKMSGSKFLLYLLSMALLELGRRVAHDQMPDGDVH